METTTLAAEGPIEVRTLADIQPKTKLTGKVTKITLAGAIVDLGLDKPGVIHISQLRKEPVNRVEDVLEVGQTVDLWVRRVFPKKGRIELTMIEPLSLEWREIEEGMVLKGTVTRLEKFGAFVEIGAERPGLVHISELAHGYVKEPGEVVKEGEEVEVKVLSVNRRKKQVKLSMKAVQPPPEPTPKPEKQTRPSRQKTEEVVAEEEAAVPTAMEIALREAMERSRQAPVEERKPTRKTEKSNDELESILARTLQHKVRTSK
jgi:predicted RNA-binding protein with RPS1 domain